MIYILDENLQIVDILKKYNFAQYNNKFRDIGTFKINAQLVDENIYILDETKQYYVLFDFDEYIFGQVTKVKQSGEGDNDKEIVIEGKLSKYILTKRVINGTINYKGKTFGLVKEIIDSNIVSSSNAKRNLPIEINYDEEYLASVCSDITKQITGGYVWEEVEKLLTQDNLGIDFVPNIITNSNTTNIDKWYLTINAGVDRTKENKYDNNPVIFSQQLSNIASVDYERDVEEYTNYAYVAGEGEEENRKWYEVNRTDKDASGWNRKELWIDARDIQSESEDGTTLSETEYEKLIKERANEKFSESDVQESYEATLTEKNAQYTYGVDYNLGDWCTITDINLNKELDVQITEITVTVQGTRKIVDVGFTYGLIKKDPIKQTQQNTININKTENNVRYLENITKPFTKAFSFLKDATGKIIGIAIGKVAEIENALEIAWNVYCKKYVYIGDSLKMWSDSEGGNIDIISGNGHTNAWDIDAHNGNLRFFTFRESDGTYKDVSFDQNGAITTNGMIKTQGDIIFGYRYASNNNAPAFVFDKPGSYYTGIGSGGSADIIHFGPVSLDGAWNWVDGYNQKWDFQGTVNSKSIYVNGREYGSYRWLWSGAWYMNANQSATLDEAISSQPNGIILLFSPYRNYVALDRGWKHFFVSKLQIPVAVGTTMDFLMADGGFDCISCKSLIINDTSIVGNASNETSGTKNGVSYNNAGYVLRGVIGI